MINEKMLHLQQMIMEIYACKRTGKFMERKSTKYQVGLSLVLSVSVGTHNTVTGVLH